MKSLEEMSVDDLLLEVLKHKGTPSNPGMTWREAFDELARRLAAAQRCSESLVCMPRKPSSTMLIKANITSKQYEWLLQATLQPEKKL